MAVYQFSMMLAGGAPVVPRNYRRSCRKRLDNHKVPYGNLLVPYTGIRWERCDDIHEASVTLGYAVISWRRLKTSPGAKSGMSSRKRSAGGAMSCTALSTACSVRRRSAVVGGSLAGSSQNSDR